MPGAFVSRVLQISPELSLPLNAVTQTFGILAKKRRGKTYTASVMAEEMIKANLPFVVLDPTGAWWGLRASADGKKAGYPVVIIGGDHADIPLEPAAGAVIADLVVEHPGWYVVDMSAMNSNAEQDWFAMEFGERLYRVKNKHRFPMMLYVDEADAFIPQQPMPDQRRLLGAYDTIVRRGGIRGIGVTLISQRPAVVNKNVLSQVECLIVLQIVGSQDRDAIEKWVGAHGAKKQCDALMSSLASLGLGEAWFWSPAWLDVFKRVQVRKRETFNSSKTPEVGEHPVKPKVLAKVDLDQLRDKVSATTERMKADDPRELRKQIAELQRQIKTTHSKSAAKPEVKTVEVPVLDERDRKWLHHSFNELRIKLAVLSDSNRRVEEAHKSAENDFKNFEKGMLRIAEAIEDRKIGKAPAPVVTVHAGKPIAPSTARAIGDMVHAAIKAVPDSPPGYIQASKPLLLSGVLDTKISRPQQNILNVLASFETIGHNHVVRPMVAAFCGVSSRGSGFEKNLGTLRKFGMIEYPNGGTMRLTDIGRALASATIELHDVAAVHDAWCAVVSLPQAEIIGVLVHIYPNDLSREEIAEKVGVSAASSGFEKNLGTLRTLGAIDYPAKGRVRAADLLFPEALR